MKQSVSISVIYILYDYYPSNELVHFCDLIVINFILSFIKLLIHAGDLDIVFDILVSTVRFSRLLAIPIFITLDKITSRN